MASGATKHFIRQRVTAIVQVPLTIWLVIAVLTQAGSSRAEMLEWVSTWWVAGLLVAWFVSVPLHMSIGIGDIIDDYLHKKSTRSALHFLTSAYALLIGIVGVFAVIAITLIA
ncbi:MAG: succinate dehydrogenase, hydrophobic membrane anchor protein [Parvularcula sp.]|jgi:succinate dehydrogenase / fumarate reductase membrane anchor subunit|nr:succinate dehydrogenase, hydrophobic membrane anchor protein [Parvularcula sp.]